MIFTSQQPPRNDALPSFVGSIPLSGWAAETGQELLRGVIVSSGAASCWTAPQEAKQALTPARRESHAAPGHSHHQAVQARGGQERPARRRRGGSHGLGGAGI